MNVKQGTQELSGVLKWFEPSLRLVWGFGIVSAAIAVVLAYSDGLSWLLVARLLLVLIAIDVARDARMLPADRQQRGMSQAVSLTAISLLINP